MVSDEQSSPWLPVNPPRESEDATPDSTADAAQGATADAAPGVVPDATPGAADAAPGSTTPPSSPGAPGNTPLPTPPAAPWIAQEWSAPSGDTAAPPAAASHETAQFGESAQPRTGQIPRVPLAD